MVENLRARNNSSLRTTEISKKWTETSENSKLNQMKSKLNDERVKMIENPKVKALYSLIEKREYRQLQKEIGMSYNKCDGKLGKYSLESFNNFLDKYVQYEETIESIQSDVHDLSNNILQNNDSTQIGVDEDVSHSDENLAHGGTNGTLSHNSQGMGHNGMNEKSLQYGGVTLASLGNDKHSIEQGIFHEWPNLGILGKKLQFDWNSRIDFIKPHLDDLNQLSAQALSKIKSTVKGICISDKTVTSRDSNKTLLGVTPRGYASGKDWSYVGGCYRAGFVYAGRSMSLSGSYYDYKQECTNNIEGTDSMVLHEIGHAFDEKYEVSTRPSFKAFHRAFYNRIGSYFQQGGPGGTAGCSEFFAEASAEFHKWGKEGFTRYYSKEFYDYMAGILS